MNKSVFFVCFTPYHLIVSCYYAMKVAWDKKTKLILVWQNIPAIKIDLTPFSRVFSEIIYIKGRDLIDIGFLSRQMYKVINEGYMWKHSEWGRMINNQSRNVVCIFSDRNKLSNKIATVVPPRDEVVLIEEGYETYSKPDTTKGLSLENLLCGSKRAEYIGQNKRIREIILRYPSIYPEDKIGKRKLIQQTEFFDDKEWCSCFLSLLNIKEDLFEREITGETILWIGQALNEDGIISYEKEVEVLSKIFNTVLDRRKGIKICIRPHPRDDTKKYKCLLCDRSRVEILDFGSANWMPIEIIARFIGFDYYFSCFSSSMFDLCKSEIGVFTYKLFNLNCDDTIRPISQSKENIVIAEKLEDIVGVTYSHKECLKPDIFTVKEDLLFFEHLNDCETM